MAETLPSRVLAYIRRHELMRAGDRVGIAVSAGADSVALLRLMLELRGELGVVLSVVHFNHKIRGADADADEQFVRALAEGHGVEFHVASGDAPRHAREQRLSLETAARKLRYTWFRRLICGGTVDRVATAHTLDDQAETVLLRLMRGAWVKGLAGIYPELRVANRALARNAEEAEGAEERGGNTRSPSLRSGQALDSRENRALARDDRAEGALARDDKAGEMQVPRLPFAALRVARDDRGFNAEDAEGAEERRGNQKGRGNRKAGEGSIVRPLLEVRRGELAQYLRGLGQPWREDASNRDLKHARNRVRHVLLPLLERDFNPAICERLAEMAEIARAEEDLFWGDEVREAYEAVRPHWVLANAEQPLPEDAEQSLPGHAPEAHLSVAALRALPLALQRRVVRVIAEELELSLSFRHVDKVLSLLNAESGSEAQLSAWWIVRRAASCPRIEQTGERGVLPGRAELVFCRKAGELRDYDYVLPVPGEALIHEAGMVIRASVIRLSEDRETGYNREALLDMHSSGTGLRVRNWRPGDRFWPAHSKSEKKVKELLQELHVSGPLRALWPVVVQGEEVVWMRGFGVAEKFAARPGESAAVVIEATKEA